MNQNQIDAFYAFCGERGLARPAELLLRNRQWESILAYRWTNLSIDRWMLFGELSKYMVKDEYTETLRWLWSHSEGDLEPPGMEIIFSNHNGTPLTILDFLTPQERQVFDAWPNTITIYRGCTNETREGLCWTQDHDVAVAFARMRASESSSGTGLVRTGQCRKADILCYMLNHLNEYEVLVRPAQVTVSNEEVVNQ